MKRIHMIAALLGFVTLMGQQMVCGQATLIDPIEVFEGSLADPENDEIAVHWDVANLTDDTLKLMVTRSIVQAVDPYNVPYTEDDPGAYDRFCWGPLCYPFGAVSSNTNPNLLVTILPGGTDSTFVADYYPAGVAGVTALEYCFVPIADFNAAVCHTVLFCLDADNCALGTSDEDAEIAWGNISPQPVKGLSTLSYELKAGQSGQVSIFNASGQEVWTKSVRQSRGLLYIDGNDFAQGLYFLTLDVNNGRPQTQKFIVQH
ncbi:MAG: T9SS type A sorting domain-containing protein [Bacteroidetes bacterium]|jgi:hypothetical protein|nr:T9SS type A sorting domain-containing protein [Bacteroidota bacterium]